MKSKERRWLWTVLSVLIAVLSVWAVASRGKEFSLVSFFSFIAHGKPLWLLAALGAVIFYILCEAKAQKLVCRRLGYSTTLLQGVEYASSDIYFSAITPSASGGQPACGVVMNRDGIPGSKATAVLLLNIAMYALSILILCPVCFLLMPRFLFRLTTLSRVMVFVGYGIQIGFAALLVLLLRSASLLERLCVGVFRFLGKLRLLRDVEGRTQRLHVKMDEYRTCTSLFSGDKKLLWRAFLWNMLERIMNVAIVPLVFLAAGGEPKLLVTLFIINVYSLIGSKFVPIPGSMVAADFLLLDGMRQVLSESDAVNLEILGRSVSFYFCVLLCGLISLIAYLRRRRRHNNSAEDSHDVP